MNRRWEVFYTYCVDASVRVDAESEQEAMDKVSEAWEKGEGEVTKPKTLDYSDFEVLYAKKR
jgi:hypothetical protein